MKTKITFENIETGNIEELEPFRIDGVMASYRFEGKIVQINLNAYNYRR